MPISIIYFLFVVKILAQAATLLPAMTEQEHGQVSRLASILLLGFLLPHSTGDEFFLLQNVSSARKYSQQQQQQQQSTGSQTSETLNNDNNNNNNTDMVDMNMNNNNMHDHVVISMPLEDRLECASRKYNADEFGELDSIMDSDVDLAFHSFLSTALRPFLVGRPAHLQQVDLLHILAMAIHPQPCEKYIQKTINELEETHSDAWEQAKPFLSSPGSHCFHVNYGHRLKLVRLVADHLVLPEYNKDRASVSAPLFQGALTHLRASLHTFVRGAMSPYDAHWAQCGLVNIAIQVGMERVVNDEWDCLLHRIADDRTNYIKCHQSQPCTTCLSNTAKTFSLMTQHCDSFCAHAARGQLLERFLTRFNESRHYADVGFLQRSLSSLADAVEWQVDCWTKASEEEEDRGQDDETENPHTTNDSPCMLASLLFATKQLFYFLLPIRNVDDESEESEESHRRDMLVSCAIQLVHHWHPDVAREASTLLILAFCYGPDDMIADYVGAVFESTKFALNEAFQEKEKEEQKQVQPGQAVAAIERMITTFSQKSVQYAHSLLSFLLSSDFQKSWKSSTASDADDAKVTMIFRLVAAVATASPVAALKHVDTLTKMLGKKETSTQTRLHLVAALLACRQARFFADGNEKTSEYILKAVLNSSNSGWDLYQLARHALVAGNYEIANKLYQQCLSLSTSETSFLWLSALDKVAEAEASLSKHAARGIPSATIQLRSAVFSLHSLSSFVGSSTADFTLQLKLLRLRLDFLDLLTGLRQLTREMRLTGAGPAKNTRPSLHLRNTVKFFNALATRYLTVYRQHGLFICQQSRTTLRSMNALCRFVANAASSTFADSLPEMNKNIVELAIKELTLPKGDASHPMTLLMQRLDKLVLKDMDSSVDPIIRAAAMLELIDGILKAPIPFPRDFTLTGPVPVAVLRLAGDPDSVDSVDEVNDVVAEGVFEDELEASPGVPFTFFASGMIPEPILKRARLPFCMVLLWHTVSYRGSIHDDDNPTEEKQDDENISSMSDGKSDSDKDWLKAMAPTTTLLSPSGKYFTSVECQPLLDEGYYTIETRLGCRDIRCGEWEIPVKQGIRLMSVHVSRSRA
jgi:integrator complex subunit 7